MSLKLISNFSSDVCTANNGFIVVLVTKLCQFFYDPVDCNPPDSSVQRIFQARMLEWVAIIFSPGDLSNPGIEPPSPAVQPPGKSQHQSALHFTYFETAYYLNSTKASKQRNESLML